MAITVIHSHLDPLPKGVPQSVMAEQTHLDELIALQTDPAARRLLEEFASVVRDPLVDSSAYAGRLRAVMDKLFKEAAGATAIPDGK